MARRHTFPGVYTDSGEGKFTLGQSATVPVPPYIPPSRYFSISGQVTQDSAPLQDVVLQFTSYGSYTTDIDGEYTGTVARNWSGYVTPNAISGGTFAPTTRAYATVTSSFANQDFVYNGTGFFGNRFVVSGTVWNQTTNTPVAGATILFDPGFGSVYTNANGVYTAVVDENYTGTLILDSWTGTVSPAQYVIGPVTTNHTALNFQAWAYITLSGLVQDFSADNAGQYPALWDDWQIDIQGYPSAYTDTDGVWTSQVLGPFSGTVSFPQDGWGTTTPLAYTLTNQTTDSLALNFDYYGPLYIIGGTVWDNWNSQYFVGMPINVTGYDTIYTDANGRWQFDASWAFQGNVTPVVTGDGSVSPASYAIDYYNQPTPPLTDLSYDFQWFYHPPPQVISGYILNGVTLEPVSGIEVNFSDIGQALADINGAYGQAVPYGWTGRATPISMDGTFDPVDRGYASQGTAAANQDFYYYPNPVAPITDCPVPGDNVLVPTTLSSIGRNVYDTTQDQVWVIDDNTGTVAYFEAAYGTVAGYVDVSGGAPASFSALGYDAVTNKLIFTDVYNYDTFIVNAATKAVEKQFLYSAGESPRSPGYHSVAVADNGTAFVSALDWAAPALNAKIVAYDLNTNSIAAQWPLPVTTRSITWLPVLQKLLVMTPGFGSPAFRLFDPITGIWEASTLTNNTTFSYETYYIPVTGHLAWGVGSGQAVRILDIDNNGTLATVIDTLPGAPTRCSDLTVDTCHDRLFVSDGNYAIYEYTLDGLYTLINVFDGGGAGVNPTGLAHSRDTNLVYYGDWNDNSIRSVQATTTGTHVSEAVWSLVQQDYPASYSGTPGNTTIDITKAGDENNMFDSSTVEFQAAIINLTGLPYGVQLTSLFDVAVDDTGTIDINSSAGYVIQGGGASDNLSWTSAGSYADVSVATGTIGLGYNLITLQATASLGGNFTVSPCTTYSHMRGTFQFTALG